ncbi:MAG: preprotein translocase subunit SecG [Deltaproteobacteria bacterium]
MLELFHTPLTVLHIIVCLLVMLVVLIQPGKSGGLGAALGGAGAQQIFGGRGAGNFLTRTTWISASVFFVTSITLAYISTSTGDSLQSLGKTRKAESTESAPADTKPADIQPAVPGAPETPLPVAPVPGSDTPGRDSPVAPAPAAPSDSRP